MAECIFFLWLILILFFLVNLEILVKIFFLLITILFLLVNFEILVKFFRGEFSHLRMYVGFQFKLEQTLYIID